MIFTKLGVNTKGYIDIWQTTYVKFTEGSSGQCIQIKFKNKKEFLIEPEPFEGISILDKHPLLDQYENSDTILYIFGKSSEHEIVAFVIMGIK